MNNSPNKPTVAITGASGLVGSHLVQYLCTRGYPIVAVVRSEESAAMLRKVIGNVCQFKIAFADTQDTMALIDAVSGANVVVHAAGSVDPYGDRKKIFAVNVDGTKAALRAAQRANLEQFIHISSLSVITQQGDQYDVGEDAPLRRCGEAYADSKVEAEKAVMAHTGTCKVTVLRPGFIYGPRERAWMPRLINSITLGKAMLIDGGKKATNVIYTTNLNKAIEGAILNPKAFGQVYNLTDGQHVSKKDLFDAIADGLSLPRVQKRVPGFIAKLAVEIVSSIAPLLSEEKQRQLSRYSRAAFRLAGINQGFSIIKAERDLNYRERIPFQQGMQETLAYFQNQNNSSQNKNSSQKNSQGTKESVSNLRV